ncbi:MAG: 16S rRNA (guanine(527)-N(7))-methyltransferase RsmG [Rhizobiaceae bacterium]|nr:16S rRNA (guanine(527)-N(7))-methyltransferase RsmG [Rhizobiaceae bacterium]
MSEERFAELQRFTRRDVSRETLARIEIFMSEFERWAARINLASPSTLPHLWERHVLDSAQLIAIAPQARRWLDLGSGGGFPGAIVGILMSEHVDGSAVLVESNAKKAAFLRTALGLAGAPTQVEQARIETCRAIGRDFDVVTARALAPLRELLNLASPWLQRGATALFHKGRDYRREIQQSRDAWDYDLLEHRSVADPESVILEIRNLRPKSQKLQ